MSKQDTSELYSQVLTDLVIRLKEKQGTERKEVQKMIQNTLETSDRNLLQAILNELPEEKEDAVKQGELIPFDKKRKVEMDWLRKCQDAGYNQALQEVKSIIEKRLKDG